MSVTYGPKMARTGDLGIGVCPAHTSPVTYIVNLVSSNPNCTADGIPIVTIGDLGLCSCGHPSIALTGAPNGTVNAKPIHRIGDGGTNPGAYTVITGSPTSDSA
jgi:uncharacterized Zn-binding protein involved in type VI secretion